MQPIEEIFRNQQKLKDLEDFGMSIKRVKILHTHNDIVDNNKKVNIHYTDPVDCRITFNYSPYNLQIKYMRQILKCLQNDSNFIGEMPTGSGKTLCILNSVFGYISTRSVKGNDRPKLIYTSRSHTQLQQLKKELQKTIYTPSLVIFGGRQKLCCNEKVKSKRNIVQSCRSAINRSKMIKKIQQSETLLNQQQKVAEQIFALKEDKFQFQQENNHNAREFLNHSKSFQDFAYQIKEQEKQACKYYSFNQNNKRKKTTYETYRPIFNDLQNLQPISIQDQYQVNKMNGLCPYFYPKPVSILADMIVMPYNYILSDKMVHRYESLIKNSVIVFDEGHNILENARQGTSFSLKGVQFLSAKKKIQHLLEFKLNWQKIIQNENSDNEYVEQVDSPKIKLQIDNENLTGNQIAKVIQYLGRIGKNFEAYEKEQSPDPYHTLWQQQDQTGLLEIKTHIQRKKILEKILHVLFRKHEFLANKEKQRQNFSQIIQYIEKNLKNFCQKMGQKLGRDFPESLSRFMEKINKIKQLIENKDFLLDHDLSVEWAISKNQREKGNKSAIKFSLKFNCLNPKYMFQKLAQFKPKSIIVTSGTLQPLESWESQTGLIFQKFSQSSSHIIQKQNVLSIFLPNDPENVKIQTTYGSGYQGEKVKGNTEKAVMWITEICKQTPGGIIVVLPSYKWLMQINRLKIDLKQTQFFQQHIKELRTFLDQFKKQVLSERGAILFCVCRGKLCQGIDFANEMCRAVVIVGLPIPNLSDPVIISKKEYYDREKLKNMSSINGEEWQDRQTMRAVNQAIGRLIRSSKDYGIIFFMDNRYKWKGKSKNYNGLISKWALRNQKTVKYKQEISKQCEVFFKERKKKLLMRLSKYQFTILFKQQLILIKVINLSSVVTIASSVIIPFQVSIIIYFYIVEVVIMLNLRYIFY